jgi:hypothetical protein
MKIRPPTSTKVHTMFVHIDWRIPQKLTNVINPRNNRATAYQGQLLAPFSMGPPINPNAVLLRAVFALRARLRRRTG